MNISKSKASWHGQKAWVLENDTIRTVVVPDVGAKIVSLVDKRTEREWLVGLGKRPFLQIPYAAPFTEQDMSGWDEMFPTIVACDYPAPGKYKGAPLPDHGEVWAMPWTVEATDKDSLRMRVQGKAIPYRLTRTLTFSNPNTLIMHYELENLSSEPMPYLWSAHPQFICPDGATIVLPPEVKEVCNSLPADWGWGEPEQRFDWPEAISVDGQPTRIDKSGPATLNKAYKFFVVPEISVGWATVVRNKTKDWLKFDWDAAQIPYLGLWVDQGIFSHEAVVAPEPMTGFYDSLTVAWEKKLVTMIEPGEVKSWSLSVSLGIENRGRSNSARKQTS